MDAVITVTLPLRYYRGCFRPTIKIEFAYFNLLDQSFL